MSKIKIESTLKSSNNNHIFKGKGIKRDNQIIYNDENVQTKITLDDVITIERKADYHIKINLKKGIKLGGIYINNYGTFDFKAIATEIIQKNNELKIIYNLTLNDTLIDTFTYKLKFSLDT